jgi:hypothetical protein
MNTPKWITWWTALSASVVAATVYAQPEQWLQYHNDHEGRGYRWLELSTNPPPNVALPKLNARAWFALWTTPMDPKGRWVCFDSSRRSGPCDRMYFDGNGNGRLDDKSAIKPSTVNQYSASFAPARVVFKGEDGPITYHLGFEFMNYERNDARLLVRSGGYYAGTVDLGGKKKKIELVDGNVNGTFNDISPDASQTDRVVVEGDKEGERFLGRMLEVDGQLYRLEAARDGAFIKIKKAENVELGRVRVPETISEFVAFGENGHFVRKPVKGEFTLPAGRYRIHQWTIDRNDERGAAWQLMGYGFNESAGFQVAADKPLTLGVGEPIRAVMQPSDATNEVEFSLRFFGRFNEQIQIMKGTQRPKGPRLTLTSLDGSYRYTNTFEFG